MVANDPSLSVPSRRFPWASVIFRVCWAYEDVLGAVGWSKGFKFRDFLPLLPVDFRRFPLASVAFCDLPWLSVEIRHFPRAA